MTSARSSHCRLVRIKTAVICFVCRLKHSFGGFSRRRRTHSFAAIPLIRQFSYRLSKTVISRSSPNSSTRYVDTTSCRSTGDPPRFWYLQSGNDQNLYYIACLYEPNAVDDDDATEIVYVQWRGRGRRIGRWNTHPIGRICIRNLLYKLQISTEHGPAYYGFLYDGCAVEIVVRPRRWLNERKENNNFGRECAARSWPRARSRNDTVSGGRVIFFILSVVPIL